MQLGVNLPNYRALGRQEAMVAIGDAAEAFGYASLWTTDHVLMPVERPDNYANILESLITLGYVAGRTERIQLGTSVLVLPQRDPVLVAKQAATIHHLSRGRLVLGVGVGWLEKEFGYLNADFANRGRNTDEFIRALRTLWSENPVSFSGNALNIDRALASPTNADLPAIPILVGGSSPIALRRVAALADGWHAINLTPDQLSDGVAAIRAHTNKPIEVSLRLRVAPGRTIDEPDAAERTLMGSSQEILDGLHAWNARGVQHFVLEPDTLELPAYLDDMERISSEILPFI